MRRLLDFYATQVRVLWEWQGGPISLLKRLIITLIVATVSFLGTIWILSPRMTVDRAADAALAVILMALFNAAIRPVVLTFAASISLVLTGLLVLVLQVVAFLVVAQWAPGVHVDGFVIALIGSFIYAIINTVLTAVLGIDSSGSYYGLLVQRLLVKRSKGHSDKPGLVIIQIDGLAHPILAGRIRAGSVNTLAGWIRDGTHKLSRWEAILPSMTSASQAGILHGNNDGIPAFRWYERDRKHLMASSNPGDATLIVSRLSNGEGLLSNNGASICNLMTGDATRSYLTTAAIKAEGGGIGESQAFMSFFFSPTGYLRSFTLFLGELFKEMFQARRTRRAGIRPQMHRGLKYAGMRAASNVLLRDVNTSLIIEEMYRGTNVIYADFTDYDELAHHCGPERVESFEALDGVDQAIATLAKATEEAPRPYKFIILSDHGQSLGETFRQRYGKSLGEYILELMGGRATLVQTTTKAEGSTFVNAFLSEITSSQGVGPTVARAALKSRTTDGVVDLDADEAPPTVLDASSIAVVGSGNLGLVWFTGHDHRLTVEELEGLHPGLVASVAAHPGVAMLLVRSAAHGAVVFGPNGTRYLDQDRVEGEDPTTLFGPHTIMSLKREDAMIHAPDLLLLSQYDPELGEVAAFEELIGSHGGLGGPQTEPFILHPVDWELDEEVPLGAPAIYRNIRRWLDSIGIQLGTPKGEREATRTDEAASQSTVVA
ncbi:MAG TPA: phage holin family protein [Candidatus Limnocylindrales bacterium]|nr:phage holin family protein [Candidatus Limnocylindrales bacterium]